MQLFIRIGIICLVVGLALGAFVVFQGSDSESDNTNNESPGAQKRNMQRIEDLKNMQMAFERFKKEHESYPVFPDFKLGDLTDQVAVDFEVSFASGQYIDSLPVDPSFGEELYYQYTTLEKGKDYRLTARLEEPYDEGQCDRDISQEVCIYSVSPQGGL